MAGKVYNVPPMPPSAQNTVYLEVGPLRIGIEYRELDPSTIESAYHGDDAHLAEIRSNSPEGGFSDEGLSIHVEGIEDNHEYLRFDSFADEPHYHYIDRRAGTNTIVEYDVAAHGEMLPWVLRCLRARLPAMLEQAGAKRLASQIDASIAGPVARSVAARLIEVGLAASDLEHHAPASTTPPGRGRSLMSQLQVEPVAACIGAEISGVDLREPLDDATVDTIHNALLDHLVLVFRNQQIAPEHQVAFARRFGEISAPPITPKYGSSPDYIVLDQTTPKGEGGDRWHSDNTFMAEPPMGSILKAVTLPRVGGDTCFSSMFAAYEDLSPAFQTLVGGLRATHDISMSMHRAIDAGHSTADLHEIQAKWPPVEHPVVRTHPITGRKALFVNGSSTTRILGVSERESEILLAYLIEHVRSPAYQCRFRWDQNTVLFWDNRSVQHFAVPDYNERRVMHRVTLAGDKPT